MWSSPFQVEGQSVPRRTAAPPVWLHQVIRGFRILSAHAGNGQRRWNCSSATLTSQRTCDSHQSKIYWTLTIDGWCVTQCHAPEPPRYPRDRHTPPGRAVSRKTSLAALRVAEGCCVHLLIQCGQRSRPHCPPKQYCGTLYEVPSSVFRRAGRLPEGRGGCRTAWSVKSTAATTVRGQAVKAYLRLPTGSSWSLEAQGSSRVCSNSPSSPDRPVVQRHVAINRLSSFG
jgi:hypothetical protein